VVAYDIAVVGSHAYGLALTCERLPRPGETVMGRDFQALLDGDGGKGSNQALAAARLGGRVMFVGKVGEDEAGRIARRALTDEGVDVRHLHADPVGRTGLGVVLADPAGESMIVVDPGASARLTVAEIEAAAPDIARASHLLTQCEQPLVLALAALRVGRRVGATTVLNPSPVPDLAEGDLRDLDVLVANEHEARTLAGPAAPGIPSDLARAVAARYGIRDVVVTLGADGVAAVCGGETHRVPAFGVEVVDTTGAGDAFAAALVLARARGRSWPDALAYGAAAGALAITGRAPWRSFPTADVLARFLAGRGRADLALAPESAGERHLG
jgi:ribokinase